MRKLIALCIAGLIAVTLVGPLSAAKTVTLEGKVLCAKCSLHVDQQDHCQNVLVVEKKRGKQKQYYMTKNEIYEQFGEVCKGTKLVRVTGTVTKEQGRKWIAPSEIATVEQPG